MSQSVWYIMGMRDGIFYGTDPADFMDTAYRFFLDLKNRSRQSASPVFVPNEREVNFTFSGRKKNVAREMGEDFYKKYFAYQPLPFGTPVKEALWYAEKPDLFSEDFDTAEEKILGETLIPHPDNGRWDKVNAMDFDLEWEKQRYRLIQKMRYCVVPLKVFCRSRGYSGVWHPWSEFHYNTGCVDQTDLLWERFSQFKISFPEYWIPEGTSFKIGITANSNMPNAPVPFNGKRWITAKEYITPYPSGDISYSSSQIRIYGFVDLATHPDWAKFFDINDLSI